MLLIHPSIVDCFHKCNRTTHAQEYTSIIQKENSLKNRVTTHVLHDNCSVKKKRFRKAHSEMVEGVPQ